jgi:hypothetical protein
MCDLLITLAAQCSAGARLAEVIAARRRRSDQETAEIEKYMASIEFKKLVASVEAKLSAGELRDSAHLGELADYDRIAAELGLPVDVAISWIASFNKKAVS